MKIEKIVEEKEEEAAMARALGEMNNERRHESKQHIVVRARCTTLDMAIRPCGCLYVHISSPHSVMVIGTHPIPLHPLCYYNCRLDGCAWEKGLCVAWLRTAMLHQNMPQPLNRTSQTVHVWFIHPTQS